jgi:xanthine dehydrogenase iron-sulfur cluster and FAD-binding subunit A
MCPRTGALCKGQCHVRQRVESDPQWYTPTSLEELAALYAANPNNKIKLIAGDTGRGITSVKVIMDTRMTLCAL